MRDDTIPWQIVMQIVREWYFANNPDAAALTGGKWQEDMIGGAVRFRFTPFGCPCSRAGCCANQDIHCPAHEEPKGNEMCESCFVKTCKSCGASCCCDL